jgi:hypothetical protein
MDFSVNWTFKRKREGVEDFGIEEWVEFGDFGIKAGIVGDKRFANSKNKFANSHFSSSLI